MCSLLCKVLVGMFILFTPFTFLFFSVYLLVIVFLLTVSNFYFFWVYMEILILLFIGTAYTVFVASYTQLILYFLMQTLASFGILVFYILEVQELLVISLFLKLGMFPFMSWYLNVLFKFPSSILLIRTTVHKLPPLLLFCLFYTSSLCNLLLVSILLSVFIGGTFIIIVLDFRYLIIVSSIANNGFLLMGLIGGSLHLFWRFFLLYLVNITFALYILGGFTKPLLKPVRPRLVIVRTLALLLINLAAMPPFPMFLAKFGVLYNFFLVLQFNLFILVILVLFNVLLIASYCQLFIKYIVNSHSSLSNYLMF